MAISTFGLELLCSEIQSASTVSLFITISLLLIIYLSSKTTRNEPPIDKGWIPWLGCATNMGEKPLQFIEQKRKEINRILRSEKEDLQKNNQTYMNQPKDPQISIWSLYRVWQIILLLMSVFTIPYQKLCCTMSRYPSTNISASTSILNDSSECNSISDDEIFENDVSIHNNSIGAPFDSSSSENSVQALNKVQRGGVTSFKTMQKSENCESDITDDTQVLKEGSTNTARNKTDTLKCTPNNLVPQAVCNIGSTCPIDCPDTTTSLAKRLPPREEDKNFSLKNKTKISLKDLESVHNKLLIEKIEKRICHGTKKNQKHLCHGIISSDGLSFYFGSRRYEECDLEPENLIAGTGANGFVFIKKHKLGGYWLLRKSFDIEKFLVTGVCAQYFCAQAGMNVPELYKVTAKDKQVQIDMEYIENAITLSDFIKTISLYQEQILPHFMVECLDFLVQVKCIGYLHNDPNLGNFLLTRKCVLYLIDFEWAVEVNNPLNADKHIATFKDNISSLISCFNMLSYLNPKSELLSILSKMESEKFGRKMGRTEGRNFNKT